MPQLGGPQHVFLSSMAAYVGLDLKEDINWVTHPAAESIQLLAEGKVDALLGFPPTRRNSEQSRLGTWWSIVWWTGPGPGTSAA